MNPEQEQPLERLKAVARVLEDHPLILQAQPALGGYKTQLDGLLNQIESTSLEKLGQDDAAANSASLSDLGDDSAPAPPSLREDLGDALEPSSDLAEQLANAENLLAAQVDPLVARLHPSEPAFALSYQAARSGEGTALGQAPQRSGGSGASSSAPGSPPLEGQNPQG